MSKTVADYKSTFPEKPAGFVVIVAGASGAGKGTVIEKLKNLRNDFVLSISTTTRPPRGEGVV
ncbi:MAG TPA: hypothetical protein ENN67_01425, partial [Firmicutes bacterium]|nr:hypothetical protein [Bacillota bacterium]